MITALNLLQNAVGLLIRSPLKTLTVLAPAFVLMFIVCLTAVLIAPENLTARGNPRTLLDGAPSSAASILILCAFVLSYAIMAIIWHRHTLRDLGAQQPVTLRLVIGYVWRALALTAIQITVNLTLIIPLLLYVNAREAAPDAPALLSVLLFTFIMQLILLWLSLRLSLILPAAALGKPISMMMSWLDTHKLARPLWGVAALLAIANTLITGFITFIDLSSPGSRLAVEMSIYVAQGLLIFSVLTTIYSFQSNRTA